MNKFHETLKKYLDIYLGQETYFLSDTRNLEFYKANPANISPQVIREKVNVVDDPDFNKLVALDLMADHILKLKIDPKLAKGDRSVVEDIARVTLNGKQENLLHFASVYCNLHKPDVFPIYSNQFLNFYKRYLEEYKLPLNPNDLGLYDVFTKAQDDLITRYGIKGKLNYLQIRKFAWVYADKVIEEADPLKN